MLKKFTLKILFLSLLISAPIVKADVENIAKYRFSISRSGQLVYDHFTNLVWQRCLHGQTFSNGSCQGKLSVIKHSDLQTTITDSARRSNLPWRLPIFEELASTVFCSGGVSDAYLKGAPNLSRSNFYELNKSQRICNGNGIATNIFPINSETEKELRGYSGRKTWTNTIGFTHGNYGSQISQKLNISLPTGYSEGEYENCSNAGCGGWNQGSGTLRLVLSGENTRLENEFPILRNEYISEGRKLLVRTNWDWKPTVDQQYMIPIKGISQKNLTDLLAMKLQDSVIAKRNQLPTLPQEPEKEANSYSPTNKGEFETTNDYKIRIEKEKLNSERDSEIRYREAMIQWQKEKQIFNTLTTEATGFSNNKIAIAKLQAEIISSIFPAALGNPSLVNIIYDADKQEFSAQILDSTGVQQGNIVANVALKDAPKVKNELLSGKLAPIVQISIPDFQLEWALKENSALRVKRFEQSKESIASLSQFLIDYPESPEASKAKSLIFDYAKTSNELHQLITKNSSWSEAKTAATMLPKMQMQEFQEARKSGSTNSYEKFINNFGGTDTRGLLTIARKEKASAQAREDTERRLAAERWERERPQREADGRSRNICEAQKQSCYASCPPRAEGFRLDSSARTQCVIQCDRISCN